MTACASCGTENGESFRFCLGCGGVLPRRAMTPARIAESEEPPAMHTASDPVTWTSTAAPPHSALELVGTATDGTSTGTHALPNATSSFGRARDGFERDPHLSLQHLSVVPHGERLRVRDEGSLNGIFLRLRPGRSERLVDGVELRLGRQLLRFEALAPQATEDEVERLGASPEGCVGRLVVVLGRRTTGAAFVIRGRGLALGRDRGDVRFPEDAFVSGAHCRIGVEGRDVFLTDLGSSNGTFLRLRDEAELGPGDVLLAGQQLLRVALASR
ncbi:MAG: FHA domain-containing protein [Deltaproteobacteria bacterium]|nr:FHA domain-containing protein [Deltaproteobacteria bacterium]